MERQLKSIKIHADRSNGWMGDDPDAFGGESMWAFDRGNNYAFINNSPFFTYGLSLYDMVQTDNDGEILRVIEPSGLANFRAIVPDEDEFKELHDKVKPFTVATEGGFNSLLVMTVAPTLSQFVTRLLDESGYGWENGN
jgi:hypothetical protein